MQPRGGRKGAVKLTGMGMQLLKIPKDGLELLIGLSCECMSCKSALNLREKILEGSKLSL